MQLSLTMCFSVDPALQHQEIMWVAMSQEILHLTTGTWACPAQTESPHVAILQLLILRCSSKILSGSGSTEGFSYILVLFCFSGIKLWHLEIMILDEKKSFSCSGYRTSVRVHVQLWTCLNLSEGNSMDLWKWHL